MALSIGIDLGTTNSVAAVATATGVEFALGASGERIHPSVVAYFDDGTILAGREARRRRSIDPANTIYSAKRLIGQNVRSPLAQLSLLSLPYHVEEGDNQQPIVLAGGRRLTIPEVSGAMLRYLKQATERQLGEEITDAVITVPANFTDAQRQATKEAGRLAGLEVMRLINEPTAAALAYGFGKGLDSFVAVFDFGGGTFDVSLLRIRNHVFEVIATDGDFFLGGDDIDRAVAEMLAANLSATLRIDPRGDPLTMTPLIMVAEEIKCRLSDEVYAEGTINGLPVDGGTQHVSLPFHVSRSQFEHVIVGYVDRTMEVCQQVMTAAGMDYKQVSEVICVGGSTRIPLVRRRIAELFGRLPGLRINPDEVVAQGAAIQAGSLSGRITQGTGMATENVVARNRRDSGLGRSATDPGWGQARSPASRADSPPLTGHEVAALGRADTGPPRPGAGRPSHDILALMPLGQMLGDEALERAPEPEAEPEYDVARPLLLDVTPATLGIATVGRYMESLVDKNAPIPIERTRVFTTAHDNQDRVLIQCCRGESRIFANNEELGALSLEGLPPRVRGDVKIEVTFRIDADGILHIRARDAQTGAEQRATLNVLGAPTGVSP